jgi:hypothetical protein
MSAVIPKNTPFRINRAFPSGNLKDYTIYIIDELNVIRIYFRYEDMFLNPPENRMYNRIAKQIDQYGVVYVEESEFKDIRKEFKHNEPLKTELSYGR